jgi:hypothetical protein
MLDEAGRESFPASDPPALMVDDGPRGRAQANEQGGSSGREREERYSWPSSARFMTSNYGRATPVVNLVTTRCTVRW